MELCDRVAGEGPANTPSELPLSTHPINAMGVLAWLRAEATNCCIKCERKACDAFMIWQKEALSGCQLHLGMVKESVEFAAVFRGFHS
jgi:hypothetical protein